MPAIEILCSPQTLRKVIYFQREKDRSYWRIWGALALPGGKPGFAVVMGEAMVSDPVLNDRKVFALAEAEHFNPNELFNECIKLQNDFHASSWFMDIRTAGYQDIIGVFNTQRLSRGLPMIKYQEAPHPENERRFKANLLLAIQLMDPKHRIFYYDDTPKLREYIEYMPADVLNQSAEEHPALSALGFALSERPRTRPDSIRFRKPRLAPRRPVYS